MKTSLIHVEKVVHFMVRRRQSLPHAQNRAYRALSFRTARVPIRHTVMTCHLRHAQPSAVRVFVALLVSVWTHGALASGATIGEGAASSCCLRPQAELWLVTARPVSLR